MTQCPYCKQDSMSYMLDQGGNDNSYTQQYFCNNCKKYFNKVYDVVFKHYTNVYGSKI